jgi:pimeloyl-ACP methyl ester carboxylesterase
MYITGYSPLNNTINVPWTVPNTPSTTSKVRVVVGYSGGSVGDVSDSNFTITQPPTLVVSSVTPASVQTEDWGQSVIYTATVKDGNGNPISAATLGGDDYVRSVSYTTAPNTTDVNGQINYTTTVPNGMANGTYNITFVVTKPGYNISGTVTRQVQVQHIPTSFGGTVTDSSTGNPISGATVTWGSSYSATTSANGVYSINNIICGTATLTVSKRGYQTFTQTYTPTCNASNAKNLSLTPGLSGYAVGGGCCFAGQLSPVFIQLFPSPGMINPSKQTWIVIHGRKSSSINTSGGNIPRLAQAIASQQKDDQVLVLDWSDAARDPDLPDYHAFSHEDWIEPVAEWAATALTTYGFSGSSLNLVGHSWGGSMTDEIAKRVPGGVNTIVALDPAENGGIDVGQVLRIAGGSYNPELKFGLPSAQINFARDSKFSWAFHTSLDGSELTPTSAHESFVVDTGLDLILPPDAHDAAVNFFSYVLEHSTDNIGATIPLFQLQRLLTHTAGPWVPDQCTTLPFLDVLWDIWEDVVPGYEAVISTASDLQNPRPFNIAYVPTTAEITVLGNGISIADGDTTPSSSDNTDFGSIVQGQTGPTRTFTVRNDGGSTLTLGSVSVPAGFILDVGLLTSLARGASDTFTVRLDTTSAGTKSGQISFSDNDSNENPFNFSVTGTVTPLPTVARPTISPDGGNYSGSVQVTLGCTTSGALIYYTLDGNEPTTSSTSYQGPFTLAISAPVKAKAFMSGYNDSATASATFTVTPVPTVARPTISPDGGNYSGSVQVTLGCTTSGALIYYTLDGNEPTTGSTSYQGPFTLAISAPVKAKAFMSGYNASATASASFTVTAAPPSMSLSYGSTAIPNGDQSPSAAKGTDFGTVWYATGSPARAFTIKNTGSGLLNLTGTPPVQFTGNNASDFGMMAPPSPPVAANGGTTTFYLVFWPAPGLASVRTALVTIASDDPNNNYYTFMVQGTVGLKIQGSVHTPAGVPVSGVVMSGLPDNPSTDATGNYSTVVNSGWSGTVTPTLGGYSFAPASLNYSGISANQGGQDYVAVATPPDTQGPALTITSPANNSRVTSGSLLVSGTASDSGYGDNGVSSVAVNGVSASGGTASGSGTANWNAIITLSPGPNAITVVAKDNLNNSSQQQITVTNISNGTASFVGTDPATQGSWQGKYGTDGYVVVNDATNYPSYATVSPAGHSDYVWEGQTGDPRCLQEVTEPGERLAACWYADSSFTMDVIVGSGQATRLALYCLDWDCIGRAQQVDLLDGVSGALLDSQTLSNFCGGKYLAWDVSGWVRVRVNPLAGNAVVSGVFFDPVGTARFTGVDGATQGNWQGKYGAEGYVVVNDAANYPSYEAVLPAGHSDFVWAWQAGNDTRCLQKVTAPGERVAACWYGDTSFTMDVAVGLGAGTRLALYCLDWDCLGRVQEVELLDGVSGAVLDSQTLSNFCGGKYLTWDMSGRVRVRLTPLVSNAVVSGVFFDDLAGPVAPSRIVAISLSSTGVAQVVVAGTKGSTYYLEASEDLVTWSRVSTSVNVEGTVRLVDDSPASQHPIRFFRAVEAR